MNTKNNSRRRSSIERIEKAFTGLLETKQLREITVSDICKIGGVNRSTFYANFLDIYDLADKIRLRLEEEVEQLYELERVQDFNSNDFLKLFYHIRENQLLYRTYFKLGYHDRPRLYQYDVNQADRFFDNQNLEYHIEFFRCGFNAVIRKWLAGGCVETPEELEEIIRREYQGRK